MNWLVRTLTTSIGKKLLMAITGLAFCGFLAAHLVGNLFLYVGKDEFNAYAEKLHSLGGLLTIAELGLLALALIHIITAVTLYFDNWAARPTRYAVDKSGGGRTLGSRTMPYTGLFLLVFVILHLLNFHFVDKTDRLIYTIVADTFSSPGYVIFYILAMIVAAIHVSHGLWSAVQTLGLNHPKYMPAVKGLGYAFAVAVGICFGFIPVYINAV